MNQAPGIEINLLTALRLPDRARLALVGAGGKTTALFQLARAFSGPVILTSTTHLGIWQASRADRHFIVEHAEDLLSLAQKMTGVTLVTGPAHGDQRLQGVNSEVLDGLRGIASRLGLPILIEADGSRQLPIKAPALHEPVIPEWVEQVVVVVGLSGLGKPIDEKTVHRVEQFALLSGEVPGAIITSQSLERVLLHEQGGRKGIPSGARTSVLLNQADSELEVEEGRRLADRLIPRYDSVVVACLEQERIAGVIEPVAGIVLAGGGSSRYGQPKMLLPWRGKPVIQHVVEAALDSGLAEVVVVTGAVDLPLRKALASLPIRFVENQDWQSGQSRSVRKGVNAISPNCGGAIFLLADQPAVSAALIRKIVEKHQQSLAPAVAPRVGERRTNPVLFDRITFPALLAVEGDRGGRALFDQYPPSYVNWDDEALLLDIDTPADYAKLRAME